LVEPVDQNRLCMRQISKRFGAVSALERVDLEVRAGEVHALVGENGAGKSTLMKILSGAYRPDSGDMTLDGIPYRPRGPLQARDLGVAMIYQELTLAPHLSVEQNVMLGRESRRCGVVRRKRMRAAVVETLERLGRADLSPTRVVGTLGPGDRQLVEIARALVGQARVVVMDEPTSALSRENTAKLFSTIGLLRDRGVSVIYISHFLEEVKEVSDRYTVLRDGRAVDSGTTAAVSTEHLIEQMVGRTIAEVFPRVEHRPAEVVLRLEELSGRGLPGGADLALRKGEIMGIAGLMGSGRSELIRALFGLEPVRSGRITVAGVADEGAHPWERLAQGVGLLSENRAGEGLAMGLSVAQNTTLSHLGPCAKYGVINLRERAALTRGWIDRLSIRCRNPEQKAHELSGGNQQKVALARLLHHDVDVLLLDEPTKGIDVGSKAEVYRLVGELAAQGKAIVFVSSYVPELLGICDRIAVMYRGQLSEALPVSEWTEVSVLDRATRGAAT
jgi:ribose transport system ATP-binding protein